MAAKRSHARKLLTLVVSVGLLGLVLTQIDISTIFTQIVDLPAEIPILLSGIIAANLLLVTVRLFLQVRAAGFKIPFIAAIRANVAGLASGLVVINLVGALAGRFYTLRRYGIDPATVAAITGIERVLLALVGGGLFLTGAVVLFGFNELMVLTQKTNLPIIIVIVLFIFMVLAFFLTERNEQAVLKRLANWSIVRFTGALIVITLTTQFAMLLTYLYAAKGFGTDATAIQILAAAAMVSFAASLPISVNGWGVREVAAVYAFGHIGIDSATALSISILVGVCSTAVVLATTPLLLMREKFRQDDSPMQATETVPPSSAAVSLFELTNSHPEKWLSLVIATSVSVLIFFQVHLDFGSTLLNINLADPLALLAVTTFALMLVRSRNILSAIPKNTLIWLVTVTIAIVLAFLNGAVQFGVTDWALTNRLFGWFILVGYFCLAAAYIFFHGQHGLRRLVQLMLLTAALVVLSTIAYRESAALYDDVWKPYSNFEGFAFNRNAFSFQLLVVLSGVVAYSRSLALSSSSTIWGILVAIVLSGIFLAQSRTGIALMAMLVILTFILGLVERRFIARWTLCAIVMVISYKYLPDIIVTALKLANIIDKDTIITFARKTIVLHHLTESNVSERWTSISEGLSIWQSNVLIGGGLGAFVERNIQSAGGGILVIHSIPVWILAEFGLVGAVLVASYPGYLLYRYRSVKVAMLPPQTVFLMCTVMTIGVYGFVHDMAFQRTFWFTLGAIAAASALRKRPYKFRGLG